MYSSKTLAAAIAARLTAVTRYGARVEETTRSIRIEVPLPDRLSDTARESLLAALADADRFGHDLAPDGGSVWAEIDTGACDKRRPSWKGHD